MGLVSCSSSQQSAPTNSQTKTSDSTPSVRLPLVVVTTSVLCDLTEQLAQDTIELKCLVAPGEDPHVYQPKPEDRKAIDSAQLILYAGYNFDTSLIKLVKASSNSVAKIAVHEVSVTKPLMGEEHEHEEEQHNQGELVADPHVWHDANNGIAIVKTIATQLEKLVPKNATQYQKNAKTITEELSQIDNWIKSSIATIPVNRRKLVTTHDALGYYVNAYSLSFAGALTGLSSEEAPTAAKVGELVQEIKQANVPTIFAETTINPQLIGTVAKEANVKVSERTLYADGVGEKGTEGDSYQKLLVANTRTIVEGLGGKYTAFQPK